MFNSLRPHRVQHVRFLCPSLSPGVCSNSCSLSQWYHPTIICHPLLPLTLIFPSISVFSNELALHIRWPKYWSFSASPSNEYSGLKSFRIDWFDLFAVWGSSTGLLDNLFASSPTAFSVSTLYRDCSYSPQPTSSSASLAPVMTHFLPPALGHMRS